MNLSIREEKLTPDSEPIFYIEGDFGILAICSSRKEAQMVIDSQVGSDV